MRLILAIQCFFALLFTGKVPAKALPAPPEPEAPKEDPEKAKLAKDLEDAQAKVKALESEKDDLTKVKEEAQKKASALESEKNDLTTVKEKLAKELDELKAKAGDASAAKGEQEKLEAKLKELEGELEETKGRADKLKEEKAASEGKLKEARDHGVLALIAWLQREGRLIDFLKEDIDEYDDEQVGAAVRAIHKGCLKVLTEGFEIENILEGEEESPVKVEKGFDPVAIQLTGNVKGDPPFKGTLMHHGWRAKSVSVPVPETVDPHVLCPAEVEL